MENWPNEGFKEVAEILLPSREKTGKNIENLYSLNRERVVDVALKIHFDAIKLSNTYFFETQHYLHITPHLFSDLLAAYKLLYNEKRVNLNDMKRRYD